MDIFTVFSVAFAALSVAALVFFVHKVIWLVRYKQLQRQLIVAAQAQMQKESEAVFERWERFSRDICKRAGDDDFEYAGPLDLVRDVEARFDRVHERLTASRVDIAPLLEETLEAAPHVGLATGETHTVLEVEPVSAAGSEQIARIRLEAQALPTPEPPDPELYALKVRSRYGFIRRALVFFAGIADVIYSSQHISVMSHHTHVPLSVILRRLSLVILLVLAIVAQVLLGLREEIEPLIGSWIVTQTPFFDGQTEAEIASSARLVTIVLWTAGVTIAYFILALLLRRRYRRYMKALSTLKEEEKGRLEAIYTTHRDAVFDWADSFASTLDTSIELTAQHLEMMAEHELHRVQRRVCGEELLGQAQAMSDVLFQQLPESSDTLQDDGLSSWRSLRHYLWPRAVEMDDIIELAQYRDAWQYIEFNLTELRRSRSDIERVDALWRRLVQYATAFPRILPDDTLETLGRSFAHMMESTLHEAQEALAEFDQTASDLITHLNDQLASATPLLAARIELAEERIRSDAALFQSEVIRTRERARMEAMAFEI